MRERTGKGLVMAASLLCGLVIAPTVGARVPIPYDWSHRHLIYSQPDTAEEALAKGEHPAWVRNYEDPRFVLSLLRRMEREDSFEFQPVIVEKAARAPAAIVAAPNPGNGRNRTPPAAPVHRDWASVMGGAGGLAAAGAFPAKYNFDIAAAPDCVNDFVVYPAAAAGNAGTGGIAQMTGTVTGAIGTGTTVVITNGTRSITLTSGTTSNVGLNFLGNTGNNNTNATNLANAINRNGNLVGVTASASTNVVTLRALTYETWGNAITATGTAANITPSGAMTGGSGTPAQPTIFALNALYNNATCQTATVGVPSTMWAYNTGTGAVVDTSPVLSLDGKQVAFIQRSGSVASLVLLKWSAAAAGTNPLGTPTTPTSVAAASYRACTAPCMTVMALSGNSNDTRSSPYYDYSGDQLWVGDDAGVLHRFTGIFSGTPAESSGSWPVTVNAGRMLSSPVYDNSKNLVFVGSAREATTTNGGRLHSVNNGTAAVITSGLLAGNPTGNVGSTGVASAPIVDQLAQRVYTFVATDASTSCGGVQCGAVYQFATNASISGLTTPKTTLGRGDVATRIMHSGVFDNAYYSSSTTSPTGALYACGSSGTTTARQPTLWRIPIAANALGTAVVGPTLVSADTADGSFGAGGCSPISDVQNGANNYIYVSVPQNGNKMGCTGVCIYMFNITSITAGTWTTGVNASAGLGANGGTSGIIIDNTSSTTGASQVYYSTSSPGSAIQASQGGLN